MGGIPLEIKDSINGFLVEPNNSKSFADKITQLLQDPDMAEQMGKKGKEIVREKFLMTRSLLDYLNLLNYMAK